MKAPDLVLSTCNGGSKGALQREAEPFVMKWTIVIFLLLSCGLSAQPQTSLAGLQLGMNETELEHILGPSDARQPKLEPGLQVWSYHLPTNLSLVVQGGCLCSVSATGDGCAPLVWQGQHLCILGVTQQQVKDKLGEPSQYQDQVWIYRQETGLWLKLYFNKETVQAALLGQP